jgi:negative regulator of flagellin synthesis FlgM
MKIKGSDPSIQGSSVQSSNSTSRASKVGSQDSKYGAKNSSAIESSDKVQISSRAKEAAKAKAIAKQAPDVNEEKVARLKAQIQSGNYNVDPHAIADKLVDEHIATGF